MNNKKRILIVEDEDPLRRLFHKRLSRKGSSVDSFASAEEALPAIERNPYDVALVDIKLPGMDGIDLLKKIKREDETVQVIVITGHGTIDSAIVAMKSGAYDYLTKPCKLSELEVLVQKAWEKKTLKESNVNLREELKLKSPYGEVIGKSKKMLDLLRLADKIALSNSTVLIEGETGTGKELLAHRIHRRSLRRDSPFIVIHCAALPETLQESELFGYERGAFSGAHKRKKGLVELADGGTLFIDEVGEISPSLQVKLLRFVETGCFRRLGGEKELHIDVRVIAATNKDLRASVKEGAFRKDLYYRLNVANLRLPPLRERKEDVSVLAEHFLKKAGAKKKLTNPALREMTNYDWPGNVRELANALEVAALISSGIQIGVEHLPFHAGEISSKKTKTLAELEKDHIRQALISTCGNKTRAARILGISLRNLYRKIDRYNITYPRDVDS
ncbi:MAG: sigma-54-dependent Fis family transcriptional regulator [Deltaproteobacteria bacterium]|nr:sigma-54-dependent Fis family transcriptional regulator [Deltaproteobacteria bacterium]